MIDLSENVRDWKVDLCAAPRDNYELSTRSVAQWCGGEGSGGVGVDRMTKAGRWLAFMGASAAVLSDMAREGGLRCEPRVGYDPVSDQPFFIFKCAREGITYLVSREGIRGVGDP